MTPVPPSPTVLAWAEYLGCDPTWLDDQVDSISDGRRGTLLEIDGKEARVRWDSGGESVVPRSSLRPLR